MDRRRLLQLAGAFLAAGSAPGALFAQTTQMTMVVPFPPGGGGDILARTVSLPFSEALRENVVIFNRPGAGGNIGTGQVVKSQPDGTTIGYVTNGIMCVNPYLYDRQSFDPFKDLTPVAGLTSIGLVLAVSPKALPDVHTAADLVKHAQARPGETAGDIGSPIIHGIGATEEDDIVRPLSSLGGGTLIVGTTQAGKGVMLTSLVTQAILRGEPVIVIDPKSSKRLRNAVWKAAEIAGRPAPLEFHPAFPETGVRLDPLGAWTRPTELATRIAAVMPPDSGAFGNFAWMAVNVAVEGLFYVTERPSLLGLRRLLEGGIDPLLKKALARSFRDAGIDDWEEQVERMDKRNICPPAANASIELTAAVALWEETVGKKDEGDANAVVGGLIAVFRHNREHYAKITASLQPVLSMLTGGTLAKSFSPDPFDPDDERPIVTVERVVEGGDILYLGLDALPDSTVAGALGSIILADLTAYAGKRYNRGESGTDVKSVSLFVDETANVINGPMIELLNKGLEAGIRVTAAMQTVSDLAARLGSDSRARMALGNFNNLIALRSKDRLTQEFICETFGKITVWSTSASLSSSADGSPVPDFRASVTRSIQGRRDEVVPPDVLGRLPNTEFFASVSGGRLYKGRIPILLSDD